MKKVLVVYGTKSGCTAGVAEQIGTALSEQGARCDVVGAKDVGDASGYDAVVVGSGVRMSQWHEPVRTWLGAQAESLKEKPVAFYTVNLTMVSEPDRVDEIRSWTDPLIADSGVSPVDVGVFPGWNEGKGFSFLERTIMNAMKAPKGDFRDYEAIDAWAEKIAGPLGIAR